ALVSCAYNETLESSVTLAASTRRSLRESFMGSSPGFFAARHFANRVPSHYRAAKQPPADRDCSGRASCSKRGAPQMQTKAGSGTLTHGTYIPRMHAFASYLTLTMT